MQNDMKKSSEGWKKWMAKLSSSTGTMEEKMSEIDDMAEDIRRKEKKAEKQEGALKKSEAHLSSLRPEEELRDDLEQLQPQVKVLTEKTRSVQSQQQQAKIRYDACNSDLTAAKRRLERMRHQKEEKLQKIYKTDNYKGQQIKTAVDWIKKNADKFRRPVLGPIAAEVTCKDESIANYLDMHCANNVLLAFVTEDKRDTDLIWREVREKLKCNINIETVDTSSPETPKRNYGERRFEQMKRDYGIQGYLDQLIDCPPIIKKALYSQSQLHNVIVGSQVTAAAVDDESLNLMDKLSVRDTEQDANAMSRGLQSVCLMFPKAAKEHYRYMSNISRHTNKANIAISMIKSFS
ncbi:hypothetical protein TeGR_g5680, partial [Tetraparma gracilis]